MEASSVSAADVARITMQAICDDDFYILPHPAVRLRVEERLRDIIGDHRHHKPEHLATIMDGPSTLKALSQWGQMISCMVPVRIGVAVVVIQKGGCGPQNRRAARTENKGRTSKFGGSSRKRRFRAYGRNSDSDHRRPGPSRERPGQALVSCTMRPSDWADAYTACSAYRGSIRMPHPREILHAPD